MEFLQIAVFMLRKRAFEPGCVEKRRLRASSGASHSSAIWHMGGALWLFECFSAFCCACLGMDGAGQHGFWTQSMGTTSRFMNLSCITLCMICDCLDRSGFALRTSLRRLLGCLAWENSN
jgi:hypothetical protein